MKDLAKYRNFTKINSTKVMNTDEDDEEKMHIHLPMYEASAVSRCIKVYLDENIKQPSYYRNLIHALDNLTEDDMLHVSINSYGGQLDSAVAILTAFQSTDAHVHCSIDGVAASAASLIALASPSLSVSPMASMMIHAATFGAFGKQGDVLSHASFIDKQVKKIMFDVYKDFLTDKELDEVFMGAEIWLTSDEILERLEKRQDILEKRYKKEQKEIQKAMKVNSQNTRKKIPDNVDALMDI